MTTTLLFIKKERCIKLAATAALSLSMLLCLSAYAQTGLNALPGAFRTTTVEMNHFAAAPYYGFESQYGFATNRFSLVPYVWLAALDGALVVNNVNTPVDIGLGDVFSNLDPALSLHFEGRSGRYSYWIDGMYLNLSSDPLTVSGRTIETSFEYVITEFAFTFHASESKAGIEPFVGGRYTNLYARVTATSQPPLSASGRNDWFDPFIGVRLTTYFTPRLPAVVRADIGGFGLGSDLTWGITAGLGFHLTDHIVLTGAYRLLDVDYRSDNGVRSFEYNAQQSGALWGIAFLF
jgi:hypothetical protein